MVYYEPFTSKTKTMLPTKTLFITCILFLCTIIPVFSQDAHYSQFFASPLILNPAMTGFMNSDYRIAIIHRKQNALRINRENGVYKGNYLSQGLSYDMTFGKEQFKPTFFAGGILVTNESSFGFASGKNIALSGAFHMYLSNKQLLGFGTQIGYTMKSIGIDGFIYPNQINSIGNAYDELVDNNEVSNQVNYLDINFGAIHHVKINRRLSFVNGLSLNHINAPKENYSNGDKYTLPMRFAIHTGAKIKIADPIKLAPNAIFITQGFSKEINLGTSIEYEIPMDFPVIVSVGSYLRRNANNNDAIIAMAGIGNNEINFGVSYDFNFGRQLLNNNLGGFEFALIYTGGIQSNTKERLLIDCPRW